MQPMRIFEKAAHFWSAYYSSGRLQVTEVGLHQMELEIVDFEKPHWAHCESVLGCAEHRVQLTGVKGVRADHLECRSKGAKRCRMRLSWQE